MYKVGDEVAVEAHYLPYPAIGTIIVKKNAPVPICRVEMKMVNGLKFVADVPEDHVRPR